MPAATTLPVGTCTQRAGLTPAFVGLRAQSLRVEVLHRPPRAEAAAAALAAGGSSTAARCEDVPLGAARARLADLLVRPQVRGTLSSAIVCDPAKRLSALQCIS